MLHLPPPSSLIQYIKINNLLQWIENFIIYQKSLCIINLNKIITLLNISYERMIFVILIDWALHLHPLF